MVQSIFGSVKKPSLFIQGSFENGSSTQEKSRISGPTWICIVIGHARAYPKILCQEDFHVLKIFFSKPERFIASKPVVTNMMRQTAAERDGHDEV